MSQQSQEVGPAMWGGQDPLGIITPATARPREVPPAPLPEAPAESRTVDLTDLAAILLMLAGAVATAVAVAVLFGPIALLLFAGVVASAAGVALAYRPGGDG